MPDILALITPEQYRLITASRDRPVIVQGRAGSGKTTVALYRVAWLTYAPENDPTVKPVDPSRVLIVMFNKALSTFVRTALAPLRLEAARLDTFHGWALAEIRRAYKGQIDVDTADRPGKAVAAALKKQVGILSAIDEYVRRQERALEAWLGERLAPYKAADLTARFRAGPASGLASGPASGRVPVLRTLYALRRETRAARDAATGAKQARLDQVLRVLEQGHRRMTQYKEELLRLLGDTALMARHLSASEEDIAALAAYQRDLQGDGATDRRPGARVAFEDLALLLRLVQLKNGGYPDAEHEDDVTLFDHVVVDEAQDFGAVELRVLMDSVRSRTGVTIVGDLNQKILPDVAFEGWDALAEELGVGGAAVTRLEVAHRSTRPIIDVADAIAGDSTQGGRPGAIPTLVRASARRARGAHRRVRPRRPRREPARPRVRGDAHRGGGEGADGHARRRHRRRRAGAPRAQQGVRVRAGRHRDQLPPGQGPRVRQRDRRRSRGERVRGHDAGAAEPVHGGDARRRSGSGSSRAAMRTRCCSRGRSRRGSSRWRRGWRR